MAVFAYRAIDGDGRVSTGNLDAVNAVDLELRLKRLGIDLLTFEGVKRSTAARTRSISREELITFCFHLSQLLKAGVNIIEALTDLRDTVDNPGFRQVIASLLEDIEGGLKLSEAMASHSYCFDSVFVALVRAGEQSGTLTQRFGHPPAVREPELREHGAGGRSAEVLDQVLAQEPHRDRV